MSEAPVVANAPRPRRYTWVWAVAFLILISIGIFFYTHRKTTQMRGNASGLPGGKPTAGGPGAGRGGFGEPIMISAEPGKKGDIGVYVSALGLVTPLNTVAVRSRV